MDPVRERDVVTRRTGHRFRGKAPCAVAVLLVLLSVSGCAGGKRGVPPPTGRSDAPYDAAPPAEGYDIPAAIPLPETEADNVAAAPAPSQDSEGPAVPAGPTEADAAPAAETAPRAAAADNTDEQKTDRVAESEPGEIASEARKGKPAPAAASAPKGAVSSAAVPVWARQKETLVYRVDFIGITMGYARFRYQGRVSIGGKVAYHLNVRAWTSGILAYIYPVNETIDYYLDAETLAPLRQEFTQREKEKDDVAFYNQETGTIIYRYRQSGEVRKKVEIPPPPIYDPVSAAYYFRWRDLGGEDRARNVYAGRKVWQISTRVLGKERIRTESGDLDTILIQPVIHREGKLENKGDLKMWLSNDERRVPVRLYAKFTKIKDWTLVGELMPAQEGG